MERKTAPSTVAVTKEEVRNALGRAKTLESVEEKALRMRYGVSESADTALPRAAGGNVELEDELLVIEMQLMRAWKARFAEHKKAEAARISEATPVASKSKDKIVRALRKKK